VPPLLVSTDFDGTIATHPPGPGFATGFFDTLERLAQTRTITWVINTGRDWDSLWAELASRGAPRLPDWVILVEREIYRVLPGARLEAHQSWNDTCTRTHQRLFAECQPLLDEIRAALSDAHNLTFVDDVGSPLGLIAASEDQADEIDRLLARLLPTHPDLIAVRNSVYFRFAHRDFNKGSCLRELGRLLDIPPEHTFAAGDHYNDLPMLARDCAHHLACPSNAVDSVKAQLRAQNGYIARLPVDQGINEALHHFFIPIP
jgi:hydroxymethylpyrimidine pyrophosphatase-like HAD family hydrolase